MLKNWHSTSLEKVYEKTKSSSAGLKQLEAEKRLKKYGENTLPHEKPFSKMRLFLKQFNNPLIYILLVSAVISISLRHYVDSIFILTVLLINAIVSFFQENKANKSLMALRKMVKFKARTLRNGNEKEIDSENVTIGDILIFKEGDKIPADCRIIKAQTLKVNEASLTGEWLSVKKTAQTLSQKISLENQKNMLFAGCSIAYGTAKAVVISIGVNTELGKIILSLKKTPEPKTPLQKKIIKMSKWLGFMILFSITFVLFLGLARGENFTDIFITSIALAVSAIPEGFLPAITVILVIAMRRILKKKGLVKKLSAAEGLGSVTVVCTDKTGTLTQGKMKVRSVLSTKNNLFNKTNKYNQNLTNLNNHSDFLAIKIGTLVNDAFVENIQDKPEKWTIKGSPTDKALLTAGVEAGINRHSLKKVMPLIDKITFNANLKLAAVLHKEKKDKNILFVTGAPEKIINHSTKINDNGIIEELNQGQVEQLVKKLEEITNQGLRVVACAYKETAPIKYKSLINLINNLTFVGFLIIEDPLRKDAKKSIKVIQQASIRPIIITGDHKLTAKFIAKELGLKVADENIIEGKQLEKLSDKKLAEKVKTSIIYARTLPHQKLRIIKALHQNKEVVAMIGDGVNDAPALKAADISVAVNSGSDVAKETADIILLDDNFKTIVKAIQQGRLAFNNLRRVFIYLLADDFSEISLFLFSITLGLPLPLLPAQILWINLIEDGFPDIALTMEKEGENEVMKHKPRNPQGSIIGPELKKWTFYIFIISSIFAILFFLVALNISDEIEKVRTLVFAFIAMDSLILAFSVRSFKKTIFRRSIFSNYWLTGAVILSLGFLILAIYVPFFQKFLFTCPLSIKDWLLIISVGLLEISLIEFIKIKTITGTRFKKSTRSL